MVVRISGGGYIGGTKRDKMDMQRTERLMIMIDKINAGRCPSVDLFCQEFEVSIRTVHADIAYLKDMMGMAIEFDHYKGGYINKDPKQSLPPIELTDGELFALTLGKDMLTEYSGTAFEPILEKAIEKISERLPGKVKIDVRDVSGVVRFKAAGIAPVSRKVFLDINRAIESKNVVQISYLGANSGQLTIRPIEPLLLVESRGAWYAMSWCKIRNAIRHFALHRIQDYKVLPETFETRPDVNPDAVLARAFLLEHGDPVQRYVIRFDASATRYIEERQWHPSQEFQKHADGSCTLSFTASRLDEVKRWVLVYGASAEVLEPKELRMMLSEEFAKGARLYETSRAQVVPLTKDKRQKRSNAAKTVKGVHQTKLYDPDSNGEPEPSVAED